MKLGVGTAIISPKVWDNISMQGMGRQEKTRGVLYDLTLQVFVLQAGGQTAVVCVMDQLFTMQEDAAELTKRCHAQVPNAHFILCATHVHSSSATPHEDSPEARRNAAAALQIVFEGFSEALTKALKDPREVEVAAGRFFVPMRLGMNRRAKLANGTCVTAWDNGAMIPPGQKVVGRSSEDAKWIDVLAFREPGKTEPMAMISSYPSHVHFYEICYFTDEAAGAGRRAVQKRHPNLTLMYSVGCCGNTAMGFAFPIPKNDEESRIAWYKEKSGAFGEAFADVIDANLPKLRYAPVNEMRYVRHQDLRMEREEAITIETLRLGPHAICGIPGEIFIEFDADLRRNLPAESLLVMTYNNSFKGYIATALGFEEGGYETIRGTVKETGYLTPTERVKADLTTGDEVVGRARQQLAELFPR
jgi:hypothetical protein